MRSAFDSVENWCPDSPSSGFRPNSIAAEQRNFYNLLFEWLRRILANYARADGVAVAKATRTNITAAITAEIAVRTGRFGGREESR